MERTRLRQTRWLAWTILGLSLLAGKMLFAKGQIVPKQTKVFKLQNPPVKPSECVLRIGSQRISPIRYGTGAPHTFGIGTGRLTIDAAKISFRDSSGKTWSAESRNGPKEPVMMACGIHTIYFCEQDDLAGNFGENKAATIFRLDVTSGKWKSPFVISVAGQPLKTRPQIVGVAESDAKLAVVAQFKNSEDFPFDRSPEQQLRLYDTAKDKLIWTQQLPAPRASVHAAGLLLAASYPNFAASNVIAVQRAPYGWVVCPSSAGPITVYDDSGNLSWKLLRPWEYERSFIGPSVWSHYLGRHGLPILTSEHNASDPPVDKEIDGSIISGPIWVPSTAASLHNWSLSPSGSLVIAVSRSRPGNYSGYTGDCAVYEFDSDGKPQTRTVIPQFVHGSLKKVLDHAIVWPGDNGALTRFRIAEKSVMQGDGPGGPDCTGLIDWFVQKQIPSGDQLSEEYPASSGPGRDSIAYTNLRAYRVNEGWYCSDLSKGIVTFPVHIFNLDSGAEAVATLDVPLTSKIVKPSANYSVGSNGFSTMGSYLVSVTGLEIEDNNLRVFLANDRKACYVDFSLGLAP